ncbi:MAG: Gmad2 immunoglobulin-like domain-containing protein [Rhodospirillaceae bacterium]|nr:Gmad2 immunoglobulin-like domain-containing protein [Rhodospirillaceae bacterium]
MTANRWRLLASSAVVMLACTMGPTRPWAGAGACDNGDGALDGAAFVIAMAPTAGARVSSGFEVSGCSRTFEGTVVWQLLARDGSVLANGFTSGGGVDGSAAFAFTVDYTVAERQIGHLEVYEEDVSDGEGYPPGRTVLPLVLQP